MTGANRVIIHIRGIAILTAQLDQLPHQLISLKGGQLIKGGYARMRIVIAVEVNYGIQSLDVVVGNGDADESLIHVPFLPFCSLLGTLI